MKTKYTFMIISRLFILRIRNVSEKNIKKIETRISCLITFFDNRAVYELMWINIVERGKPQMTIWRMRIACWITKATNTQ
jgi:hypothetical protein